jgi:FlaA1/EpsC-like NDP-sugar epimerase
MIRSIKKHNSLEKAIFILGEGLLIFLAVALVSLSTMVEQAKLGEILKIVWLKVLLIVFVTQLCLYFNDLYEEYLSHNLIELVTGIIQSIGITSVVLGFIYFLWPLTMVGRWIFLGSVTFLVAFLISWRFLYTLVIHKRYFTERAMIVGDGELARDIVKEMAERKGCGCDI